MTLINIKRYINELHIHILDLLSSNVVVITCLVSDNLLVKVEDIYSEMWKIAEIL